MEVFDESWSSLSVYTSALIVSVIGLTSFLLGIWTFNKKWRGKEQAERNRGTLLRTMPASLQIKRLEWLVGYEV